jgi:hypothetical protein
MNPALRNQIHRRNLVRFRQILADLDSGEIVAGLQEYFGTDGFEEQKRRDGMELQ